MGHTRRGDARGATLQFVSHMLSHLSLTFIALSRLHTLKKDASQIGMNARKAVKFLDRVSSGKDDTTSDPVIVQGPDEQYATWAEVEQHYTESTTTEDHHEQKLQSHDAAEKAEERRKTVESAGGALSQMLLNKLNFAKASDAKSPESTPSTSPSVSEPQSFKTSPEAKSTTLTVHDKSPTPPALKPLINSVVWYTYETKNARPGSDLLFLTNAADTAGLVRDFGVTPKTIHQLKTSIGMEEMDLKNRDKYQKKHVTPPPIAVPESEPKPLFKFEEEDSDDEIVVFKPRGGRGTRSNGSVRGSPSSHSRNKHSQGQLVVSASTPIDFNKPQIPVNEIDPDSFDRGSFAKGSVPLVNTGSHAHQPFANFTRGVPNRGGFVANGLPRGAYLRGSSRGLERGSLRGRGRLFVP